MPPNQAKGEAIWTPAEMLIVTLVSNRRAVTLYQLVEETLLSPRRSRSCDCAPEGTRRAVCKRTGAA
jgi:hypothetical protein